MPTIQGVTSIAAGSTNSNVLSGSVYEYLPADCHVEIAVVGDTAGDLRATVMSGSDTLLQESPISRQNRMPIYPDDFSLSDFASGGERLVIAARNTDTVNAENLFWAVKITF